MSYNDQYHNYQQFNNQYPNQYYQQPNIPPPYPQQVQVVIPSLIYHQPQPPTQPQVLRSAPQSYSQQGLGSDGTQDLRYAQYHQVHDYEQANIENLPPTNTARSQPQAAQKFVPQPQTKHQPQTRSLPLDYQVLLLALADEYLEAAHGHGMLLALAERRAQIDQYYKLVATALGCIESVLHMPQRLPPLEEAQLRLRYAQILYEETENGLDAETALSKGIELCERNKLLDLKYTMQALLTRVLYRSNPRAALKATDGMIEDVEVYHHIAYEYVFRFLRATTSLFTGSHQDFIAAIHQLQKISTLAKQQNDVVVFAFAGVMESLVHLQGPNHDSVDSAQRALATARAVQLNHDVSNNPQMQILVGFIDLCCSLQDSNVEAKNHLDQIAQKLHNMQQTMDQIVNDPNWHHDGSFYLSLSKRSMAGISISQNGLISERDGKLALAMNWLPKSDVYALGYLLSAVSVSHKNAADGHKAEKFLDEGLRLVRTNMSSEEAVSSSLALASERNKWRQVLECQCLLDKTFLLCARGEWGPARTTLDEVHLIGHDLGTNYPPELGCIARYLDGTIYQGTGDLATALSIFQSPTFTIPETSPNKTSRNDIKRDISLLAALNTILIIHIPSHPSHHLLQPLLAKIAPYLQANTSTTTATSSPLLQSAHSLVVSILTGLPSTSFSASSSSSSSFTTQTSDTVTAAVSPTPTPILRTKAHLGSALAVARRIGCASIVSVSLALMTDKFFKGVVGEQAEKSARASAAMARKSGSKLWTSVCDGMLAETLEVQGKRRESEKVREEVEKAVLELPVALQGKV